MDVGRRAMRTLVMVVAAAAIVGGGAMPALAQEDADQPLVPGLEVEATLGLNGWVDTQGDNLAVIDISSDELLVGRLEVKISGSTVGEPIEVPAGSTKRYALDLPVFGASRQATVVVTRGEAAEEVYSEQIRVKVATDELLVTVWDLDEAIAPIRSATTVPTGRSVIAEPVDAAQAFRVGDVAQYLVVGPSTVSTLEPAQVDSLTRWVERGGRIIGPSGEVSTIVEIGGATILPNTSVGVVRVGDGEVAVALDAASYTATEWGNVLRDVASPLLIRRFDTRTSVGNELMTAATSGREASVPALPWLLLGIGAFVILVGPVNFLALRALKKPELAWATVPVLSGAFVALFWVIGTGQIPDFTLAQSTVLIDEFDSTTGTGGVLLQVEQGGDRTVVFPPSWEATRLSVAGINPGATDETVGDRDAITFELDDLGLAAIQVEFDAEGVPVIVDAEPGGEGLMITATNATPWEFWAWGVVLNGRAISGDGTLAAGAEGVIDAAVGRGTSSQYEGIISAGVTMRRVTDTVAADFDTVRALSLVAESDISDELRGANLWFFGYTSDPEYSYTIDEVDGVGAGTSLVVKRVSLAEEAALALGRTEPEILSIVGASSIEGYGPDIYAYGADEVYFKYVVPQGLATTVRVSPGFTAFEVMEVYDWSAGAFVPAEWDRSFALDGLVSPGGEIVVRGSKPEGEDRYYDDSLNLGRFSLRWDQA